jgi:hypothetical protein
MSGADTLLARLDGVRETGRGRWLAKCPAHSDRSPSLSVRECDDGMILVHCFAQCDAGAVLGAVGLELRDLFPVALPGSRNAGLPPRRKPFPAADALKALAHESRIIAIVASDIAEGKSVPAEDADRVALAAGRIGAAMEVVS